uniref:Uncharacterized protein n=1 Tax=Strombidium inclinatum TaxID=197538 RepID=A0A7S3N1B8_9SPIT|mmetsp:Transcript_3830/g.5801  ORF Transcript_3830/g.5801 Transcript_3830/m.5801 type:complete len:270 (+) Transcript_3830:793-1602(+)
MLRIGAELAGVPVRRIVRIILIMGVRTAPGEFTKLSRRRRGIVSFLVGEPVLTVVEALFSEPFLVPSPVRRRVVFVFVRGPLLRIPWRVALLLVWRRRPRIRVLLLGVLTLDLPQQVRSVLKEVTVLEALEVGAISAFMEVVHIELADEAREVTMFEVLFQYFVLELVLVLNHKASAVGGPLDDAVRFVRHDVVGLREERRDVHLGVAPCFRAFIEGMGAVLLLGIFRRLGDPRLLGVFRSLGDGRKCHFLRLFPLRFVLAILGVGVLS